MIRLVPKDRTLSRAKYRNMQSWLRYSMRLSAPRAEVQIWEAMMYGFSTTPSLTEAEMEAQHEAFPWNPPKLKAS